jgi:hypothetical protein
MPEPHVHHGMTVALNDKIYVFGGFMRPGKDIAWQPVDNAWEYSPATDSWKAIAPLPTKRGGGVAVAVDGKVYVIGGATILPGTSDPAIRFDGKPHDMCVGVNEEYDPAKNSWRARAPMPTARNHFLGAAVNGKIYAIGVAAWPVASTRAAFMLPAENSRTTRSWLRSGPSKLTIPEITHGIRACRACASPATASPALSSAMNCMSLPATFRRREFPASPLTPTRTTCSISPSRLNACLRIALDPTVESTPS